MFPFNEFLDAGFHRHDGEKSESLFWVLNAVSEVLKGFRAGLKSNFDGRKHYGYGQIQGCHFDVVGQ
jgi:hypothetical protein